MTNATNETPWARGLFRDRKDAKKHPHANDEIKKAARIADVPLWKIADELGFKSDSAFSRYLRQEPTEEERTLMFDALKKLEGEAV